ncbi:MAG TPA: gephyrin-like molybdotransferase Glp [Rhizomicrobium sp.]|nr:gephyrin-like molybdotransferase Glp [Rhizomicrobium sp.]
MPAKRGLAGVAEARATMLAAVKVMDSETVPLEQALYRVLAEAVSAARDQPPFSASAMDGYALRSADTPGRFRLIGESAAGRGFLGRCEAGTIIRISTGAPLPDGADTIVIQEDVTREGDEVIVPAAAPGNYIRPRGGDFNAGSVLLRGGRRLDGVALGLAAAAGAAVLPVMRRPRVTILSSGDELAAPGTAPGPFQIYDSATYGIAALIRSWGGEPRRLAIERDDAQAIARAAQQGLKDSDLLVVLGGASVGDHDHAKPALLRLGLQIAVEKIALRPGKPTWFGVTPQGPVLGLPGNPASALVCACIFLRPLIEAMLGRDPAACVAFRRARLVQALPANGPREHYLRAHIDSNVDGKLTARAFENQDSSLLSVFSAANGFIRLAPDEPARDAGAAVDVLLLDTL